MEFINTLIFLWMAITSCMVETKSITLENYYAPNEILELKKIIQFINKAIIKDCSEPRLECYNDFFNQFENFEANADIEIPISQEGELQLLQDLNPEIYKDIWIDCEIERNFKVDSAIHLQKICINPKGRFAKFLIEFTSKHDRLNTYGQDFDIIPDYTPAMNGILLKFHNWFDIESQDELLLMSIHLLTLNYPGKLK